MTELKAKKDLNKGIKYVRAYDNEKRPVEEWLNVKKGESIKVEELNEQLLQLIDKGDLEIVKLKPKTPSKKSGKK